MKIDLDFFDSVDLKDKTIADYILNTFISYDLNTNLDWTFIKHSESAYAICNCQIPCALTNIRSQDDDRIYFSNRIKEVKGTILNIKVDLLGELDYEDWLTDDALEFYKELYNVEYLEDLRISQFCDFCDELDESDIDFLKIDTFVRKNYVGILDLRPNDLDNLTSIEDITYSGMYGAYSFIIKLDDSLYDKYFLYASQNWNFTVSVVYNGEDIKFFSKRAEALDYMEEYLDNIIEEGREDEINWDFCYVKPSMVQLDYYGNEELDEMVLSRVYACDLSKYRQYLDQFIEKHKGE